MKIKNLLFILLIALPVWRAEANDILGRRIDVSFQQIPLKDAMDELARKGGFEWSYNADIIDGRRKITLAVQGLTVREILYKMLGDQYTVKQNGNYLILRRNKKPQQKLSGYVKDPKTGQNIANATIYDRKTLRSTQSDSNGYYELKVLPRTEIMISKAEYRDTLVMIGPQTPRFIQVEMRQDSIPSWKIHLQEVGKTIERYSREIESFFVGASQSVRLLNVRDSLVRRFQISLAPMIGSNHIMSGNVINNFSLNATVGFSRGCYGFEAAGIGNISRENVLGFQAAGLFNRTGGRLTGFQAAGLFNRVLGETIGFQAAGVVNLNQSAVVGFQAAGLLNDASGHFSGIQVAGLANHAGNVRFGAVQLAGLSNFAKKGVVNLQIAGLANRAETLNGFQISGFWNKAQKANGVQVGLVNYADTISGLQIGLLNLSNHGGYLAAELSSNDICNINLGFKTGTNGLYTTFTAGYSPRGNPDSAIIAYGIGLGSRLPIGKHFGISLDLLSRMVQAGNYSGYTLQLWSQAALGLELKLNRNFMLVAGPSINLFTSEIPKASYPDLQTILQPKNTIRRWTDGDLRYWTWAGWTAGLRWRF